MVQPVSPDVTVALRQPTHFASNVGCRTLSHAMPVILSREKSTVDWRSARAIVLLRSAAPLENACSWPGLTLVVVARSSWQPPHTRDSPARAENHTGSFWI